MRTPGMFFFWGDHPVPEKPRRSSSQRHKMRKQATPSHPNRQAIRESMTPSIDYSNSDDSSTSSNSSEPSWSSDSGVSSPNYSEEPTREDVKKQTIGTTIPLELLRLMCFAPEEPETLVITEKQKSTTEEETLDEDHIIFFERELGMSGQSRAGISYDESFIEDLESRSEYEQPRLRPTTIQVQPKRNDTTSSACEDRNSKCSFDSDDGDSICEPPSELFVSKPNDIESDDDSSISDSSFSSDESSWDGSEVDPSFDASSGGSSFSEKSSDSEMQNFTISDQMTAEAPLRSQTNNCNQSEEVNDVLPKTTIGHLSQPVRTVVTLKVSRRDFKKQQKTMEHDTDPNIIDTPTNTAPPREEHLPNSFIIPVCVSESCDAESLHLGREESQAVILQSSFEDAPDVGVQTIGHQTIPQANLHDTIPTNISEEETIVSLNTPFAVLEIKSAEADEERRTLPQEPIPCEIQKQEDVHIAEVTQSQGLADKADAVTVAAIEARDDIAEMQKLAKIQRINLMMSGHAAPLPSTGNAESAKNACKIEKPMLPRHRGTNKVVAEEAAPIPCPNNARSTRIDFLKTVRGVKNAQPKIPADETPKQSEKDDTPISPSSNPDQWTARNVRERRRIRMGKLRVARATNATKPKALVPQKSQV